MTNEIIIYINFAAFMTRMLRAVTHGGHTHCVTGKVPICKAPAFVKKLNAKYHIGLGMNQGACRKRNGKANCILFLYWNGQDNWLHFYLLITSGKGRVWQEERPLDVRKKAIIVPDALRQAEYVLVRKQLAKGRKSVSTWAMTRKSMVHWKERFYRVALLHMRPDAAELMRLLHTAPSFYGIRRDALEIERDFLRYWRRHNAGQEPPKRPLIGYMSNRNHRVGHVFILLSDLVCRLCK